MPEPGRQLLALCLLALSAGLPAQPLTFSDWVSPEELRHSALRQAAEATGSTGWAAELLRQGQRLPQASARALARELLRDPRLPAQLQQTLRASFPSEAAELQDRGAELKASSEEIKTGLDKVEQGIARVQKILESNLYRGETRPSAIISLGLYYDLDGANGRKIQTYGHTWWQEVDILFRGGFPGGTFSADIYTGGDDTGYIDPWSPSVGFAAIFETGILDAVELKTLSKRQPLSTLIYSTFVPANRKQAESIERRNAQIGRMRSLGLRKQGRSGYWFFSDAQFIWGWNTPGFFDGTKASTLTNRKVTDEFAGRLDINGIGLFDLLQDGVLYAACGLNEAEPATLNATAYALPAQKVESYALGWNSQLAGGGLLFLEGATSRLDTVNAPGPSYQDQAGTLTLSKTLGDYSVQLLGFYVGPYFITGNRSNLYTENTQAGVTLDSLVDDPRPGNAGGTAWQTIFREPLSPANNTSSAILQAAMTKPWGAWGLGGGWGNQIHPSGPWIQARHYNRYFSVSKQPGRFGPGSPGNTGFEVYNRPSFGAASYRGSSAGNVSWQELDYFVKNYNEETVLLSRGGRGDAELRADSVKSASFAKVTGSLDLQGIFSTPYPRKILAFVEMRNLDEATGTPLLRQNYAMAELDWNLNAQVALWFQASYEAFASDASYVPIFNHDRAWTLGSTLDLSKWVSGLSYDLSLGGIHHLDSFYGDRDFSSWAASVSFYYSFL